MNGIARKVWAFVVVHHEIIQEHNQIESFMKRRFSGNQLMDGSQMKVESKRMHVKLLAYLKLEKKGIFC